MDGDTIRPVKPPPITRPIDTVIVIKKGKTPAQLKEEQDKRAKAVILRDPAFCQCVQMSIEVADTLGYNTYINYKFIFKNTCPEPVWVSTKHFRFVPLNAFGKPVRVIRKLGFVVRHDYPDFVQLLPNEEQAFKYADDAFFEYALDRANFYKFQFMYTNTQDSYKKDPKHTFRCYKKQEVGIFIK